MLMIFEPFIIYNKLHQLQGKGAGFHTHAQVLQLTVAVDQCVFYRETDKRKK